MDVASVGGPRRTSCPLISGTTRYVQRSKLTLTVVWGSCAYVEARGNSVELVLLQLYVGPRD